MQIIPTILTQNYQHLEGQLLNLAQFFNRVQIDIVDGHFAKNQTLLPETLAQINTNLALDFHLMVSRPENWIDRCISDFADRIIAHIEMMPDQIQFVKTVKNSNLSVGLALDLVTPLEKLDLLTLPLLDTLLLMSVPAGFGGQKLDQSIFKKIKAVKDQRKNTNSNFTIYVDGGVSPQNIKPLAQTGVDEVAIGRRLTTGNIPDNLEKLAQALKYGN